MPRYLLWLVVSSNYVYDMEITLSRGGTSSLDQKLQLLLSSSSTCSGPGGGIHSR